MMTEVQLRCPLGPGRLFAKLKSEGRRPQVVEGNLIEMACQDCRRFRRRAGEEVEMVYHRFNLAGELVETEVVPGGDR